MVNKPLIITAAGEDLATGFNKILRVGGDLAATSLFAVFTQPHKGLDAWPAMPQTGSGRRSEISS